MDNLRTATIRSTGHHRLHEVQSSAQAVTARPLHLHRRMSLEDAFRTTVLECLAHVAANIAPVLRARDMEGLHQLRVGLRRLHVAFSAFGEEFRTPALMDLRARTKAFADAVAPARDLDVFIEELLAPMAGRLGHDESVKVLLARAEEARRSAWDEAAAHIASTEFDVFQDDAAAAAEARSWLDGRDAVDLKARLAVRVPVKPAAERLMEEQLIRARKRGRRLKTLEDREFHRTRIALKRLRYAAEFYGPLFKKKAVKRYLDRMKKLQDLLGRINDAAQVRSVLARLLADETLSAHIQADLYFTAGLINGWHRARAERLCKKALRRWDKFKRQEPFWA
ncbi:MAG TPA: CHAD domain-containing protein [Rhizomicrobium sp.]